MLGGDVPLEDVFSNKSGVPSFVGGWDTSSLEPTQYCLHRWRARELGRRSLQGQVRAQILEDSHVKSSAITTPKAVPEIGEQASHTLE
eukprot:3692972-Amphidinium_carterae.1